MEVRALEESILNGTKRTLGIDPDYTAFDHEIVVHINTALAILSQLGVGPAGGLSIHDATTTWAALTDQDNELNTVKTYIYLKVRNFFDPPATSFLIKAQEDQMRELEWRIRAKRESTSWTRPTVPMDERSD
jgi:hypothetical protein